MSVATLPKSPVKGKWKKVRDEWIAELEMMADDVQRWAAENDWDTKRESKEIVEDDIGTYEVPLVRIATMQGRIYFEPTARFVGRATGRIEIIAVPSFFEVVLVKIDGRWRFMSTDTLKLKDLRTNWTREGFTRIVTNLLKRR